MVLESEGSAQVKIERQVFGPKFGISFSVNQWIQWAFPPRRCNGPANILKTNANVAEYKVSAIMSRFDQ